MTATPPPARPDGAGADRVRTDVAVVGAGVAGLYAATRLPDGLDVVVVDKGAGDGAGSSPWAQGGLAVALGPDDSPARHAEDTCRAGDGLCDPVAVAILTREAPAQVATLVQLGARFDRAAGAADAAGDGPEAGAVADGRLAGLDLAREGGQSVARSVHRADATGAELVRVLRAAAAPRVQRLPGAVRSLAQDDDGRVTGLWVRSEGRLVAVEARAVLLATGGCGGLYAATTNPDSATGDGLALAGAAGAVLRDLEFVQFHPTGMALPGAWRFLLTEALRGAGATLHDAAGRRFLVDRHPDAELAPRHVVAKAILDQPGGVAYLDATRLPDHDLAHDFPTVLHGALRHGFDLRRERVPVTPAAHYQVGGVRTDLDGRTSLPGLYAAGEVAATGVHGANRMAGNSLTEALVFGARTAASLAAELAPRPGGLGPPPADGPPRRVDTAAVRDELRASMLEAAGPIRDGAGLDALAKRLAELSDRLAVPGPDPAELELHHAVRAAALVVRGARLRTESRGGHWREDHPAADPAWAGVHLEQVGLVT